MKTKLQAVELVQRQMMLGSLLKAIRNENGGMQIDYALKLGYVKPTFLSNVEKGTSSIPQAKIIDYAKLYLPEEKEKLATAIIYFTLPELWEVIASSVPSLLGSNKTTDDMTSAIDEWLNDKFRKYNISAEPYMAAA